MLGLGVTVRVNHSMLMRPTVYPQAPFVNWTRPAKDWRLMTDHLKTTYNGIPFYHVSDSACQA